jgi:LDH2 family malate/lactate/ureidoglycolate dehydrogenase
VLYGEPRGSILPLGGIANGYKGFGLGFLLDIFSGALSGGQCSNPAVTPRSANAVFFLVLDVSHFSGTDYFLQEVRSLCESVRSCPRASGVNEIKLPGDPERQERARRKVAGITLDEATWGQLVEAAERRNVRVPVFV